MNQQSLAREAIVAVRGSLPRLAQTVETRQHQLLSDEPLEFWGHRHGPNSLRAAGRGARQLTRSLLIQIGGNVSKHNHLRLGRIDASEHNAKNFYVAATRPTESLTICSANPKIRFDA